MGTSVTQAKNGAQWSLVMKTGFLALTVLMVTAGCSKLQQDPLSDQPNSIRNGVPPQNVPKPPANKAKSSDSLLIEAPTAAEFKEGEPGEMTITGRALEDIRGQKPVVDISIDNMTDFPGASYDAVSGKFTWTPQAGFVQVNYSRNIELEISLTSRETAVQRIQQTILIQVTRAKIDPSIESIDDLTTVSTQEGMTREFSIVVRDPHSADQDRQRPVLTITTGGTGATAANLISMKSAGTTPNPVRDPNDPYRWTFKMVLDLTNRELTTGKNALSFGVMAVSRFGESSPVRTASASIVTSIGEPFITWNMNEPIDVVQGRENTVSFSVFDPRSESKLSVTFDTRCDITLGTGSSCSCKPTTSAAGVTTSLCTIRWNVPPTASGQYRIEMSALNESKFDSQSKKTPFVRFLRVVIPGVPPPPFVLPGDLKIEEPAPWTPQPSSKFNNGGSY